MALAAGTRLGPYEIHSALGAGGMGEVYRARDTRLDRTVALKVLAPELAASPEQQARFEREARAVGALQHPHICVLHDIGREGGTQYLVMEYLEGETLAARLRRGPLPLAELVKVGGEIADALEQAHRAGIIHRDLKPGNVMLTPAGAKLLDFGLAKARSLGGLGAAPSFTATLAATELGSPATQAGTVVGTVQYMSPEQIQGQAADARSDLFALGCVLYECATGQRAFAGKTSLSVAAAILEQEPAPLRQLQPLTPPALAMVVERCLRKAAAERWQAAADVHWALAWAGGPGAVAPAPAPAAAPARRGWLVGALAAAAVAAVLAAAWLGFRPGPARARSITEVSAPPGTHFNFGGIDPGPPVIAPDGREIAFVAQGAGGRRHVWVRALDQPAARELSGTDDATLPFWSPDSQQLGYFTTNDINNAGQLRVLDLANGQSRAVADAPIARGGSWGADGTILLAPLVNGGIYRVPASGGTPALVAKLAAPFSSLRYPYFLPDGRHFIYMAVSHDDASRDMLYWAALNGSASRPLVHAVTAGIYSGGCLLYSAQGTLMAQPLDASSGQLGAAALAVAHGVYDDAITWRPAYSAAATGALVYATGSEGAQQVAWVDRSGHPLAALPAFPGAAFTAALAPDGRRLALSIDQGLQDIWIDTPGGGRSRLTFGPLANIIPVWSPDGHSVAYASQIGNYTELWRRSANGAAAPVAIPGAGPSIAAVPGAWTPDGRQVLAALQRTDHRFELVVLPVAGGSAPRVLLPPTRDELNFPRLSADGRWVAYLDGQPGQLPQLFVMPFAGGGGKWQVTTQGVENYFWVQGGRELDVLDGSGQLLAIPVSESSGVPAFGADRLLAANFPPVLTASADGQRFLAIFYPDDHQHLVVDSHWRAQIGH